MQPRGWRRKFKQAARVSTFNAGCPKQNGTLSDAEQQRSRSNARERQAGQSSTAIVSFSRWDASFDPTVPRFGQAMTTALTKTKTQAGVEPKAALPAAPTAYRPSSESLQGWLLAHRTQAAEARVSCRGAKFPCDATASPLGSQESRCGQWHGGFAAMGSACALVALLLEVGTENRAEGRCSTSCTVTGISECAASRPPWTVDGTRIPNGTIG